jgi:hypothetical protein
MVNELRELLRDNVAAPPPDDGGLLGIVTAGRRRVRRRRRVVVGGAALATAAVVSIGAWARLDPSPADLVAAGVPRPPGQVVRLADARPASEGTDYRTLTSHTNEDLESDNGEYFDGVTEDGLVLFREGQTADRDGRYALMDSATGEKDWLDGWSSDLQAWPVELGTDQLVVMRAVHDDADGRVRPELDVFDRGTATWRTIGWPTLPDQDSLPQVSIGPDGRAYVSVLTDPGDLPDGGWPTGPDGEADDSDAEGDVKALWSVSLTDPADVRDEGLRVGELGFDGDRMVWTDSSNGAAGRVHVRDLVTGEETSFDPGLGERCNLLDLDVSGGRIAMTQYCGTYDSGVRDDRVQVMTTDGEQVVTVQDSGVDGGTLVGEGDFVTLTAYEPTTRGTYLYDIEEGRLLRLSDAHAQWTVASGPAPGDQFLWAEPAGGKLGPFGRSGATAHLSEVVR